MGFRIWAYMEQFIRRSHWLEIYMGAGSWFRVLGFGLQYVSSLPSYNSVTIESFDTVKLYFHQPLAWVQPHFTLHLFLDDFPSLSTQLAYHILPKTLANLPRCSSWQRDLNQSWNALNTFLFNSTFLYRLYVTFEKQMLKLVTQKINASTKTS